MKAIMAAALMTAFGAISCPHYEMVPKDFGANLSFRKAMLTQAAANPAFAAQLKTMCQQDLLFYINTFCWTHDPRQPFIKKLPFITYGFQDEALLKMADAVITGKDVALPKSRTMGASWMGLTTFEWFWHFRKDMDFGLISRTEKYVDELGNPKSLMWKIDYLHENQPKWLLPTNRQLGADDPNRKSLHLKNADTGSVFSGESTTGDIFRGGRLSALFIDEFAAFDLDAGFRTLNATRDVTFCRIFNSTPQGASNAFYEVVHNTAAVIINMHWSRHPVYSQTLYSSTKKPNGEYELNLLSDWTGQVDVLRKGEKEARTVQFPEEYPFILDGKKRSAWYDKECARCVTEMEIAQELDIDFLGSEYQFFDSETIKALTEKYCREPELVGRLEFDSETLQPTRFVEDPKGPLMLWMSLGADGLPPRDRRFAIGTDVSAGTGASNSVSSVVDVASGEKVGVLRSPHIRPTPWADHTIALANFFNRAFMVWDASGPTGKNFTMRVLDQRYTNIYYRRQEDKVNAKITDTPGYHLNPDARATLLESYREALGNHTFINRSRNGMQETLQFTVQPGGKVEHSQAANSQDPTGARTAHGDEVIADALAGKGLTEKGQIRKRQEPEPPAGSLAWRRKQAQQQMAMTAPDELGAGW